MSVAPMAPESEAELLRRAQALAGVSLAQLASAQGRQVPLDMARAKGWVGTLVEKTLGASAGSRAEPDFPALGVELKTLPITRDGQPRETTFVCTIELDRIPEIEWPESRVKKKLNRVLWVPVEADPLLPIAERRLGAPLLWSPDAEEEAQLCFDWEELAGQIACAGAASVTAHWGKYLQVRPKAAHGAVRRRAVDAAGEPYAANPRGFYLRTCFTQSLLRKHYARMR